MTWRLASSATWAAPAHTRPANNSAVNNDYAERGCVAAAASAAVRRPGATVRHLRAASDPRRRPPPTARPTADPSRRDRRPATIGDWRRHAATLAVHATGDKNRPHLGGGEFTSLSEKVKDDDQDAVALRREKVNTNI